MKAWMAMLLAAAGTAAGGGDRAQEAAALYADGATVTFPVLEKKTEPAYPPLAVRTSEPGVVVLSGTVGADGKVDKKSLEVIHAAPRNMGFEQAAVAAVKRWRYRPGTRDGVPVSVHFDWVVDFAIRVADGVKERNSWTEFWLECRREAFAAQEAGDPEEAERRFRHVVFDAEHFGEDDPRLVMALRDLGSFLAGEGRPDEAIIPFERVLAILEEAPEAGTPDLAGTLQDLGRAHLAMEDCDLAEPLLRRALEIRETALGPDHADTLSVREDLERCVTP
ncbi:MAG: TonB family protein [Acidobacteriota bacterium]|jgi:TonB family protein